MLPRRSRAAWPLRSRASTTRSHAAGPLRASDTSKLCTAARVASRRLREALAVIDAAGSPRRRRTSRARGPAPDARARTGSRDRRGDRRARARRTPARVVTGAHGPLPPTARTRARAARQAHGGEGGQTGPCPRSRRGQRTHRGASHRPTIAVAGGAHRAHRPTRARGAGGIGRRRDDLRARSPACAAHRDQEAPIRARAPAAARPGSRSPTPFDC